MSSPVVGAARIEYSADLAAFAEQSQARLEEAMTAVRETVQAGLATIEPVAAESGSATGRAFSAALDTSLDLSTPQSTRAAAYLADATSAALRESLITASSSWDTVIPEAFATSLDLSTKESTAAARALGEMTSAAIAEGVRAGAPAIEAAVAEDAEATAGIAEKLFGEAGVKAGEAFGEASKETMTGLRGALLGGVAVLGLGEVAVKGVETADQLEAANIKIEGAFGESSESVEKWAQTMAAKLGQSAIDAENTAGQFGQMFHAMGIGQDEAAGMSEKLDELVQNVAKFNNTDPASVTQAFTAAMRGRGKALMQLGINLDSTTLAAEAMSHGIVQSAVDQTKLTAAQDAAAKAVANAAKVDKDKNSTDLQKKVATDAVTAAQQKLTDVMGGQIPTLTQSQKGEAAYYAILDGTKNQQNAVANSAETLAQRKKVLGAEVTDLEAKIGNALVPTLTKLAKFLTADVIPAIQSAGHWIAQNKGWIEPLVAALLAAAAAFKIVSIAIGVFNAVMDADPIVLIVAALVALGIGLYEAYEHSKTFRDIVQDVWHAVQAAVSFAWHDVIKPVVDALVVAFQAVWRFLQSAWNNVGHPIFTAISAYIKIQFDIVKAIFAGLVIAGMIVWKLLEAAWNTVGKPVFDALAAIARWVWNNVLQPVFAQLRADWTVLWGVVQAVYNNVIQPVFAAIGAVVQWLWTNVLQPGWALIQLGWNTLWAGVQMVYNSVIKPVFDAIGTAISDVWNGVLQPIFSAIGSAWSALWNGLSSVASAAWGGVKGVINGIIGGINDMVDAIDAVIGAIDAVHVPSWVPGIGGDSAGIPKIPHIPTFATGVRNFSGGLAIVGEDGPELADLAPGTSITPNRDLMARLRQTPPPAAPTPTPSHGPLVHIDKIEQRPNEDGQALARRVSTEMAWQFAGIGAGAG